MQLIKYMLGLFLVFQISLFANSRPNILVVLVDDQGFADVGIHKDSAPDISTPNIDALAKSGAIFTNGYTSGYICSPTRLGLMTGRYQQRYGTYTGGACGLGIDPKFPMIPKFLADSGYTNMAFGKWHLGLSEEHHPLNRGFHHFYGFMGRGSHDYFDLSKDSGSKKDPRPIYRDLEPIDDRGYLTTRITEEAVKFIHQQKDNPWFAYVAYNAVHSPAQAPETKPDDPVRKILLAMIKHLDIGVGNLVQALKDTGVYENTLVFYLSDNGGAPGMEANNSPFRGAKHDDYEGGVHVPFFVSWPKYIPAGSICEVPVSSLDVLVTACHATDVKIPESHKPDGVNIIPAIKGEISQLRDHLFWNGGEGKWAVRSHDGWKLVSVKGEQQLFNLKTDISESKDLYDQYPEKAESLIKAYQTWLSELPDPVKGMKEWSNQLVKNKKNKTKKSKKEKKG